MLCAWATVMNAQLQIWHVDPNCNEDDGTNGSGISWSDPCTLPFAVQQATAGDEIWVKKGTYQVNLIILKKLKIYGGFNGTESSLSDRALTSMSDYTVLQPQHIDSLSIVNVNPNPFAFCNPDSTLWPNRFCHLDSFVMDGFTLENGSFTLINTKFLGGWGAGIMADSVYHLFLRNMTVRYNNAFWGGGIYLQNIQQGVMENVLFTNNYAQNLGGGLFLSNCYNYTMINTAFTHNRAGLSNTPYLADRYVQGSAAFYFEKCNVTVHNMTVHANDLSNNTNPDQNHNSGCINMTDVCFYNSIFYPDTIHVFYNHDNTVSYNNCCMWTISNPLELQGFNPIPYMGNWSNIIWDYDIHNTVITNGVMNVDPQIIISAEGYPELDPGSPCIDAAGPFQPFYPGDIFDVKRQHRFENDMDLGACEYQKNNNQ